MPDIQTPGVFIQEMTPRGPIQGVPTSIPAFVGFTETGPVGVPTLVTSWQTFQAIFGVPVWQSFTALAVYAFFIEGGSACYVVRTVDASAASAGAKIGDLELVASSPGTWGAMLRVAVIDTSSASREKSMPSPIFSILILIEAPARANPLPTDLASQLFAALVRHNTLETVTFGARAYYVLERYDGLVGGSLQNWARYAPSFDNSLFVRIKSPASGATIARPPNTATPVAFTGGVDATHDLPASIETLQTVEGISLLAAPDTATAILPTGESDHVAQAATIGAIMGKCEVRRDMIYVADPPYGLSVDAMLGFMNGSVTDASSLASNYAAIYYPWLYAGSPWSQLVVPLPPSGPVLGCYARTDTDVGVFRAPAGTSNGALVSIVALDASIRDSDQDRLNPNGVNAIRAMTGYGIVIWGARTLSRDPEWRYVSVSRLITYVEQSLMKGLQWVVFEPSSPQLCDMVKSDITEFLLKLWYQGGLMGAKGEEAFIVNCYYSNNSPAPGEPELLNVDIGLAVTRPAEFMMIRFALKVSNTRGT